MYEQNLTDAFWFYQPLFLLDEYNGYSLLDAVRNGDISRVKKLLTNETIHFRHFKTGDSLLVSFLIMQIWCERDPLTSSMWLALHRRQSIVVKW